MKPLVTSLGCALALGVVVAVGVKAEDSDRWSFKVTLAKDLQDILFGSAARQGWLGGEHPFSFHIGNGQYVWMFGDSFTNFSDGVNVGAAVGSSAASCNYYPSRRCSMPTNTFAMWDNSMPDVALTFHAQLDDRTGEPTSILWPPGWGGAGRTPKEPTCNSCSLWRDASVLGKAGCGNHSTIQLDKGGCCSKSASQPVCRGFCCHDELYLKPMTGITSSDGDRVLILANMMRDSQEMKNGGSTYGTMAVAVNVASAPVPTAWDYVVDRMPGTEAQPWENPGIVPEFFSSIISARHPINKDLVFLLGNQGDDKVLARANLSDLLDFRWDNMEFWSVRKSWMHYLDENVIPELGMLWRSPNPTAALHFNAMLHRWVAAEVDSETNMIMFRLAQNITGPYDMWPIGVVPPEFLSNSSWWGISTVTVHPELASKRCPFVLSLVFTWRLADEIPPAPGLHNYPQLLCVSVEHKGADDGNSSEQASLGVIATGQLSSKSECDAGNLANLVEKLACSDLGDGCHSCVERTKWIVSHEGMHIDDALELIAAEFPKECGDVVHCADELRDYIALEQVWLMPKEGASPGRFARILGGAATLLVLGSFVMLLRRKGSWAGSPRQLGISPSDQEQMLCEIQAAPVQTSSNFHFEDSWLPRGA